MEFVQKKGANKHTFILHQDYFNFAYEDKSGSGDSDMNYADFPQKSSVQIEQNEWLRNVGYLWMALGVFQMIYAVYSQGALAGKGFWLLVGGACVAWAYFSKVKYTVFRSEQGNVFVIHDAKHDQIIDELNKRRKEQLRHWYGHINPDNDQENEIRKFRWLTEQGAVSQAEAEQKIAQIKLLANNVASVETDSLH